MNKYQNFIDKLIEQTNSGLIKWENARDYFTEQTSAVLSEWDYLGAQFFRHEWHTVDLDRSFFFESEKITVALVYESSESGRMGRVSPLRANLYVFASRHSSASAIPIEHDNVDELARCILEIKNSKNNRDLLIDEYISNSP